MVKKISCRVVSSVPFGKTSIKSLSVRRPNSQHYDSQDFAADTRLTDIANLANHLKGLNAILGAPNEFQTGQVVDFYA